MTFLGQDNPFPSETKLPEVLQALTGTPSITFFFFCIYFFYFVSLHVLPACMYVQPVTVGSPGTGVMDGWRLNPGSP